MRVSHVKIKNVLGIQDLEFSPGALTIVSGGNGVGKTSLLEALRTLSGGHDATLRRAGSDLSEVVVVVEDGPTFTRRIGESKSPLKVTGGEGEGTPQAQANALFDGLGLNPVTFLTASKKDALRYLLETVPVAVSLEELTAAIGAPFRPRPGYDPRNGFEVLDGLSKEFTAERQGVNRAAKEKANTVSQLEAMLPPEVEPGESVLEITGQLDALHSGERIALAPIAAKQLADVARIESARDAQVEELRRQAQAVKDEAAAAIRQAEKDADAERAKVLANSATLRTELTARLATAQERERAESRAVQARKDIATLRADVERLEGQSAEHTAAIEGLAALRETLLKRLPVPGLEVRDGEIFLDGTPFDRVNQARRVKVAMRLAVERSLSTNGVPLIVVDGLECLDQPTFKAFCEVAPECGAQLIVSRVSEGPLRIDTYQPAA